MKKSFNLILRAGVAAATLTLAGAASAATSNLTADGSYFDTVLSAKSAAFGDTNVAAGAWDVTFGGTTFWAYCLDPLTSLNPVLNNYSATAYAATTAETRLYDYFYASSVVAPATSSNVTAAAFQLALWELHNDNSSLTSGSLSFAGTSKNGLVYASQDEVKLATQMLTLATDSSVALKNAYTFTTLSSANSQQLLSVSPVPEAQTWAMLAAGLGLIGFMGRRRKSA